MKTNTTIKQLFLVSTFSVLLLSCSEKEVEKKSTKEIQNEQGIPVRVESAKIEDVQLIRKYGGNLSGHIQKSVYAGLPEYVKNIRVEVGQKVRKGQILATLDEAGNTPQYRQAKAQFEVLKITKERMESLQETGGVAQQKIDEVNAQYNAAEAAFDAVRKNIQIEAPISGVVTDIYKREGEVAIAGKEEHPFMQISDLSKVIAKIKVPESDIHYFQKGLKAKVKIGGKVYDGTVVKVPLAANPKTRYFYVDVLFKNPEKKIFPGVYKQVEVAVKQAKGVAIPIDALIMKDDKMFVYVNESGKAKKREINPLLVTDEAVVADQNFSQENQLITSGMSLLKEGAKVKIIAPANGQ